jgi:hypothetical protein
MVPLWKRLARYSAIRAAVGGHPAISAAQLKDMPE